MDTPKSKNKEYIKTYRSKQKALGRRARLLWLTDEEAEVAKTAVRNFRHPELLID